MTDRGDSDHFDVDVPAVVVCATCGAVDCAGCRRDVQPARIASAIPWERDGFTLRSFWSTARATTVDGQAFFERLLDGPTAPALGFAVGVEALASASFVAVFECIVLALFPELIDVRHPRASLWGLFKWSTLLFLAMTITLVLAHVIHGLSLDVGARRRGGPGQIGCALRFGLYATGWDLMFSPIGVVITIFTEGIRRAFSLMAILNGLPTRCSLGLLKGAYHLSDRPSKDALFVSYVAAAIVTLVSACLLLGLVTAVSLNG